MTPAINRLKKAKVKFHLHQYDHDPQTHAYGEEAAEKLQVPFDRLFKTLIVMVNNEELMVAVVPVAKQLDLKSFAKAVDAKKAVMADKNEVERTTGYILGGVSPIGQKKQLKTVVDTTALSHDTVFVSAGRRGLQMELSPDDLCKETGAAFKKIAG